jgi:hypothetical protein
MDDAWPSVPPQRLPDRNPPGARLVAEEDLGVIFFNQGKSLRLGQRVNFCGQIELGRHVFDRSDEHGIVARVARAQPSIKLMHPDLELVL